MMICYELGADRFATVPRMCVCRAVL